MEKTKFNVSLFKLRVLCQISYLSNNYKQHTFYSKIFD